MTRKVFLSAFLALLGGCASPWVAYQEAVRCHLDDKGPECDAKYQSAIRQNNKLPGIHSSYGTHLLLQGKSEQAAEEFKLEQQNFPTESSKAISMLLNPTPAPAAPEPPPPVRDTTATTAVPDSTSSVASPESKPAPAAKKASSTKKGVNRAK